MRVGKGGEDLGGTVGKRSSEDKEGSCCVPCVVCVLPSSLLPLFQHIFVELIYDNLTFIYMLTWESFVQNQNIVNVG